MSIPRESESDAAAPRRPAEVLDRTSPIPLYHQLEAALLKLIADAQLGPGALFPSEPRLAADFGVTRPTVRQALDRLVRVGVLRRERGRGTFVAKPPERSTPQPAEATIKVILPSLGDLIHLRVLTGIVDEAHRQRVQVVLTHSDNSHDAQERELASAVSLAGVMIWPVSEAGPDRALAGLQAAGVPVVFIDRYLDADSHHVVVDDEDGAHQATAHLLDLGHRRIAFVHGEAASLSSVQLRLRGYRRALRERGVEADRRLVCALRSVTVPPDPRAVRRAVDRLLTLPQPATAALGVNDVIAIALLKELEGRGVGVPRNFSLVGFDALEQPGDGRTLTSVRRATGELGREGTRILVGLIRSGASERHTVVLPASLIVGDTTAPVRRHRSRASTPPPHDRAVRETPPALDPRNP